MATLNPTTAGQHLHQERSVKLDKRKNIIFKGKLFYLDLSRNKQTQLLAKAIYKMGGIIEGFLSKDVNYVVTRSREPAGIANGRSGDKRGACLPTQTAEKMAPVPCSRGKQLLKKVIQNQVLDYLELPTHRRKNKITEVKCVERGSGCTRLKVAKLKIPFLKIEDHSRKFRPLQCSFTSFPEVSFMSSDRSPFETACTNYSTPKERDHGEQDEVEWSNLPHAWEKSGYCECCQVAYTKLSEHLISKQHCFFALDATNYKVIDDITAHITCDLKEMPYESIHAEQHAGDVPYSIKEPPLSDAEEEQEMAFSGRLFMENDVAHTVEENDGWLPELLSLENIVANPAEVHKACLLEKLSVENIVEPSCAEKTANAQVNCKVPLLLNCETGGASHFGHVTEVSWYTEETVLSSVYTVQSVFTPPAHVADEHLKLDTSSLLHPQMFLNTLGDPLGSLVTGDFADSCNEPMQEEAISSVDTEPQITPAACHCTKLIVNEPIVALGELCNGLFAGSPCGKVCTLHPLDTSAQQPLDSPADRGMSVISVIDSAVELREKLLFAGVQNEPLLNVPCGLHTELSNSLALDQLTLGPVHRTPADNEMVTPSSAVLGNLTDSRDPDHQLANTDWFRGKRKLCWSPSHPPAKRQPYQWQPAPVRVLHQFPNTGQWPSVPLFTDCMGKDSSDLITGGAATFPTCFNPNLIQYNASSDSDWDSQLPSQQHNVPQQSARYGDLRIAQINLSKSRYANQLCSVLARDQTLWSPTTAQTVTLSHTSYDLLPS